MTEIKFKPTMRNYVVKKAVGAEMWAQRQVSRAAAALRREEGQGTVEYAIILGVIAVIAMLVIMAFREKIQELWSAIQNGINSLDTKVTT